MEGFIEIYKVGKTGKELLFEDNNLIVDGAKEHIVNMLTLPETPSALSIDGRLDASNFDIKAVTLGGPKESFDYRDSRFYPSATMESSVASSVHHLHPYTNNWNFSGYSPNLLVAGSNMRVLSDRDFKNSLDGGTDWTFNTVKGTPVLSYEEGLKFKSVQPDEQVIASQKISLKPNVNYRFILKGYGTDPIEMRLSRVESSTYYISSKEYFDFSKKRFLLTSEIVPTPPVNQIDLGSTLGEFVVEFKVPEYQKDIDARGITIDYELELLLPRFSDDVFSELKIEHVELIDLDLEIFKNNEFTERDSFLLNSNFRRRTPHDSEGGKLLNLDTLEYWTSNSPLRDSSTIIDDFSTSASVRYITSADVQNGSEPEEGYIALRAGNPDTSANCVAYIQQAFTLDPSLFTDLWVGGTTHGRYDGVQLYLNFWYKSESATAKDLKIEITNTTKDLIYNADPTYATDRWAADGQYASFPASTSWIFSSTPVFLDPTFSEDEIRIRIRGNGVTTTNALQDYYIKDLSFGTIPGWDYSYSHLSSTLELKEDGGIKIIEADDLTTGTDTATHISKQFTEIDKDKAYYVIVKYSAERSYTEGGGYFQFWNNALAGASIGEYYLASSCSGTWGHHAGGGTGFAFSGTGGDIVTSSFGPIYNFPTEGDTYRLKFDVGAHGKWLTLYDVKLVDAATMLDSSYPDLDVKDERTSEYNANFRTQAAFHCKNRWFLNNAVAPRDNAEVLIKDNYVDFTYREGDGAQKALYYSIQNKDMHLLKDSILKASFNHYESSLDSLSLKVSIVPDSTMTKPSLDTDWQLAWDWSTGEWRNENPYSGKFTETVTPNTSNSTYPFESYISSDIAMPDSNSIDDTSWWLFKIKPDNTTDDANFKLGDFRLYSVRAAEDVSGFLPERVNPLDKTLQTSGAGAAQQGHHLNFIEFSGTAESSSLTLEELLQHGCYLPGSGIYMSSSTFGAPASNDFSGTLSGTLNGLGVINSDGFILESIVSRTSQTVLDSSAGFVVSSTPTATVSAMDASSWVEGEGREVKYQLSLMANDWKFLDYYYGGIGSMGLWTLDYEKTAKKLGGEFGNPPFWSPESGTPYSTSLYNLTDTTQNPVFKLFAKKVFFPGGLKIPENTSYDDHITIIWGIKF